MTLVILNNTRTDSRGSVVVVAVFVWLVCRGTVCGLDDVALGRCQLESGSSTTNRRPAHWLMHAHAQVLDYAWNHLDVEGHEILACGDRGQRAWSERGLCL